MNILTWNINGIRSAMPKGLSQILDSGVWDVVCLQETRTSQKAIPAIPGGYGAAWSFANKNGYAGTAILCKSNPLSVHEGLDDERFDAEGRSITIEVPEAYIVNLYAPVCQAGFARLDYRLAWEECVREYIANLMVIKPVIVCGDLNVAATEYDVFSPIMFQNLPGFSFKEKQEFKKLTDLGLVDLWRAQNPYEKQYTWWSNAGNCRKLNRGWRLDYILVQESLIKGDSTACNASVRIMKEILGSDHCPVSMRIDF
jgi:exodeoxyribonuclease-3